jgi:tetratricopeptide (TPR) repeat protein
MSDTVFTDPTYLRTIFDGLATGELHKDNSSALAAGLLEMYEDALAKELNVNKRQEMLRFFAVWALLKKDVSACFVAPLLGWSEKQVQDYIAIYSKWFNAPVSGKYELYHERLRTFLLQKISHEHFTACNNTFIQLGQAALTKQSGDEWEHYALEHLSTNLLLQAMETGNADALRAMAYSTSHWNRQVEISKEFEWSKRMLNDMMLWAAKYNQEEVIECALNKVDLHQKEQNDATRVVELVAQNEMDTALQRIEAFGGNDKEGLQRRFTLYMLCLMELTLLESKDKPFRTEAIEKLLMHLDANMPVDHSVLNWEEFLPDNLMFQIASMVKDLDLNPLIIYSRKYSGEMAWGNESERFNESDSSLAKIQNENLFSEAINIDYMFSDADHINNLSDYEKINILEDIAEALSKPITIANITKTTQAILEFASGIINIKEDKSLALTEISVALYNKGFVTEASAVLQESLATARKIIINRGDRNFAMKTILFELFKQNKTGEIVSVLLEEAVSILPGQEGFVSGADVLSEYAVNLAKQGKLKQMRKCIRFIPEDFSHWNHSRTLINVAGELVRKGDVQAALNMEWLTKDSQTQFDILLKIATELSRKGLFDKALECANEIKKDWRAYNPIRIKFLALIHISDELFNHGRITESISVLKQASQCVLDIENHEDKIISIQEVANKFASRGCLGEAKEYVNEIVDYADKSSVLKVIAIEMARQGQESEASAIMQKAIENAKLIETESTKGKVIKDIALALVDINKLMEAVEIVEIINYETVKGNVIKAIAVALVQQDNLKESSRLINGIADTYERMSALKDVSAVLFNQSKFAESSEMMQQVFEGLNDNLLAEYERNLLVVETAEQLMLQKNWVMAEKLYLAITAHENRIHFINSMLKIAGGLPVAEILRFAENFNDGEMQKMYLKKYTLQLPASKVDKDVILSSIPVFTSNPEALESMIKKYALHEILFDDVSEDKINRFQRTLDIQWAVDIKNSIHAN